MSSRDEKVVEFLVGKEISDAEKSERVMTEATRLAGLGPGEWCIWIDRSAERLGVPRVNLEAAVTDIIRDREKKAHTNAAEQRRIEQRVEKQRDKAKREEEREQQKIERERHKTEKEKQKAFAAFIKLPSEKHDAELSKLAKRLDEDVVTLREEFAEFVAVESSALPASSEWHVEPWPESVAAGVLLQELIDKISKHVVARPHEVLAIALWVVMSWTHEVAATHSVYLVATSVEPDSGKTTLLSVIGYLTAKPFTAVESTGPSIFRFVDREKPTLLVDEADDLFARKADVRHIFNAGWTRGAKVARQVTIQGISMTQWFDIFCPKAVGLLGLNLPRTLVGRSIVIRLRPKTAEEKVENFSHLDDEEFSDLRRKLMRWSADNALALKDAKPTCPAGFNNRLMANWRLLLAIAELAGGDWPKKARAASERLSHTVRKPSWRIRLLMAFQNIFVGGRKEITSKAVVADLTAGDDSIWCDYSRGGPITQRQIADLLEDFEIYPVNIGSKRLRGYRAKDFVDAFARYPPRDPHILSSGGRK